MGRGRSKVGGGGGKAPAQAKTPGGMTYDQFMQLDEQARFQKMKDIIADSSIVAPDYLDRSDTTKVMYALGMPNKPTVVDDATLDGMQGQELFRTVYESGVMPPPSSGAVLDQIRHGDFTQMSGRGGSAHGRAIYFATQYTDSVVYGKYQQNAQVMRAKINANAKIPREHTLRQQMNAKNFSVSSDHHDNIALYALSQGVHGWSSLSYTMIVNRSGLTVSSKSKSITTKRGTGVARQWRTAKDAN